jgi:hypothetical protein
VRQNPSPPQTLQDNTFQELLEVDYPADLQNNQNTVQIYGGWVALYSASNRHVGLV